MANRYHLPRKGQTRFNCPKCGAFSAQDWRALNHKVGQDEYGRGQFELVRDKDVMKHWQASLCSGCDDHSLWIGDDLIYPVNRNGLGVPEPVNGMPLEVEELYREASAVLPHSRRAAAALCRASLERLTKHLTSDLPPKRSLDERLIVLSNKTTSALAKGLQFIRHAGNTALHGARDDDESAVIYMDGEESDLVELFFATINELVDELITRPERINAAYELLPKEKREAIERKMGERDSPRTTPSAPAAS